MGWHGKPFEMLKFRTMVRDADARKHEFAHLNRHLEPGGDPRMFKIVNDPRVTSVGRVLRRYFIDELPQLINVLKGDMSLVGPRPERPYFVDQFAREIPFYAARHSVNPGVTGWAQVRYRYGASKEDAVQKFQYDLYYVKNHSLVFDLMVLLQTVEVVLFRIGSR